ncbi:MAG TPA: hypothetical protein VN257_03625, partial [Actinotalea sp.]|nr:hypothetical protein [Actinotalea sp.]
LGGTASPRLTEEDLLPGSEDAFGVEAVVVEAVVPDGAAHDEAATRGAAGDVQEVAAAADEGDGTAMAIAWMREHGWSPPDVVPSDLEIVDLRQRADGVLEVELAGEDAHVVVLERHGVLEPAALADAAPIVLGDVRAHLVSVAPWSAVMQSGDSVVVVVCEGTPIDGLRMLAAMPATPADTGAVARVARGWDVVRASLGGVVAG